MTIDAIVKLQHDYFATGKTKDVHYRKECLERLYESIEENEPAVYYALQKDLCKSQQEAYITEVGLVKQEIKLQMANLEKWSRNKKIWAPMSMFGIKQYVKREPYGVVLVMATWNTPFYMMMMPMIGAIAAGNCVIVKGSRKSETTNKVVASIINSTFDKKLVYAIEESLGYEDILKQSYNYIFFTGNERVGKRVLRTAADNLIPVTVALGGKCPCILDDTADPDMAAKYIIWGKIINAGQTSIAPDYVVVPKSMKAQFIESCKKYISEYVRDPFNNDSYPKIINVHHFMRLTKYLMGVSGLIGGRYDDDLLKIEPTIFPNATFDDDIMKEEIFGPLLPVIEYTDIDDVMMEITGRPGVLACYIFSEDNGFVELASEHLVTGCVCVNDVMIQHFNNQLPFGGVGPSGYGSYHGKASFELFTYPKSMVKTVGGLNNKLRFPPFTDDGFNSVSNFIK